MSTNARWWTVAWRWIVFDWYIVESDGSEWYIQHLARDFRIYPGLDLHATQTIADSLNRKP